MCLLNSEENFYSMPTLLCITTTDFTIRRPLGRQISHDQSSNMHEYFIHSITKATKSISLVESHDHDILEDSTQHKTSYKHI